MFFIITIFCLSPLFVYIIHALLIRLVKDKSLQLTAIFSALLGNIPLFLIILIYLIKSNIAVSEVIISVIYSMIIYNALAYVYFHVFNMSETARRIHILINLVKTGRMEKQCLAMEYNAKDIVSVRLDRLVSMKQLRREGDVYKVNKGFLLLAARIYSIWVRLLGF